MQSSMGPESFREGGKTDNRNEVIKLFKKMVKKVGLGGWGWISGGMNQRIIISYNSYSFYFIGTKFDHIV